MALEEYWRKRKFEKTPEPKGEVKVTGKSRFVVHDHYAEKAGHHHDFRLEMEGVLKSWAIPKLVPEEKGIKRLAISVEDHPVCLAPSTKVITPEGEKSIKGRFPEVLSYNFGTNRVEFKKVVASKKQSTNDNECLTIYFHQGKSLKTLKCTITHEIFTPEGKKLVRELKKGDFILVLKECFQKKKKELLLGMLLGDATLTTTEYSNTASLSFTHSIDQKDYLFLKCKLLGLKFSFQKFAPKVQKIKKYIAHFKESIRATSKSYPFLYDYYLLCYKNHRKTLTKEWLDQLSEISLAYFYLDDGSILKDKGRIHAIELATQGYSKKEQLMLKETLEKKFGLKANIYKANCGSGWRLRISSVKKFFELIYPWIPPKIMEYKLGKYCPKCGKLITNFRTKICPNCLLAYLRELNYPSYGEYSRFRYLYKNPGPAPKTFQNYFGTWENAIRLAKENKLIISEKIGSRVKEIENEKMIKSVGLAKIREIRKGWNRKRKNSYDIQVEKTNNYFANSVLVGNSYINFKGIIPKGEYGAGEVKIFDKGNYKLIEKDENKIVFELKGKKLKGVYTLVKLKGKKNQWLIFKTK